MTEPLPTCERCDDPIEERFCTHRDLCPSCLHLCDDCAVEFAETAAYESERDG